ncbi:MAG: DUF2851 family protein [Lentisphaeria bacterium]|nr:DUF2851 family protein [Lentisphaeria bacterium]
MNQTTYLHTQQDVLASIFNGFSLVAEESSVYFQEYILQVIWNEGFLSEELLLENGQKLEVIHPGVWNLEEGPDFKDACLSIDGQLYHGPVELHLFPQQWFQHGHQYDSNYKNVICHVVWDAKEHQYMPEGIPVLQVKKYLTKSIDDVSAWVNQTGYPYGEKVKPHKLSEYFATLSDTKLTARFEAVGITVFMEKARCFAKAIQGYGLDTVMYRKLSRAMGYKNNSDSFESMATQIPLNELSGEKEKAFALLLGTTGLLPDPSIQPTLPKYKNFILNCWQEWWKYRNYFDSINGIAAKGRPFNHPTRRIFALYLLLQKLSFKPGQILFDLAQKSAPEKLESYSLDVLDISAMGYLNFYTFSKELNQCGKLIGQERRHDIYVNILLPLWAGKALLEKDVRLINKLQFAYRLAGPIQMNVDLKEGIHHLIEPPARARCLKGAAIQQGIMHLNRGLQKQSLL